MQCFKPAPASAAGTWGPGQQPVMALLCRPCAGRDCVTRSQSSGYSKGLGMVTPGGASNGLQRKPDQKLGCIHVRR